MELYQNHSPLSGESDASPSEERATASLLHPLWEIVFTPNTLILASNSNIPKKGAEFVVEARPLNLPLHP